MELKAQQENGWIRAISTRICTCIYRLATRDRHGGSELSHCAPLSARRATMLKQQSGNYLPKKKLLSTSLAN